MHVCVCQLTFPVAVIRYHDQNQLKEGNLFWFSGPEGEFTVQRESTAAGESWWLNVRQEVDRSLLRHRKQRKQTGGEGETACPQPHASSMWIPRRIQNFPKQHHQCDHCWNTWACGDTTKVCVWVWTCVIAGAVRVQRVKDKENGGNLHCEMIRTKTEHRALRVLGRCVLLRSLFYFLFWHGGLAKFLPVSVSCHYMI